MLKKLLVLVAAATISVSSFAIGSRDVENAGFNKLSETQKAAVIANIESTAGTSSDGITPEKVEQWLDIGPKVGKMFAGAARELGVEVNNFASTPVGLMASSIIIWKFLGSAIMHAVGALMILTVGFGWLLWIARNSLRVENVYSETAKNWLGRPLLIKHCRGSFDLNDISFYSIAGALIMGFAAIALFTF